MTELTGDTTYLELRRGRGCYLETANLRGRIEEIDVQSGGTRAIGDARGGSLQRALAAADMNTELMFELDVTADEKAPATRAIGGAREGEPAAKLVIPETDANAGYAMLHTDEAGVIRWIFPESRVTAQTTRGATTEIVFHIPHSAALPAPKTVAGQAVTRGAIEETGKQLVQVLTWNIEDFIGRTMLEIVTRWENEKRSYKMLAVHAGGFDQSVAWDFVSGGRALLLLHGTLSTTSGSFGNMPRADLEKLLSLYQNRVIAFNHPSLHQSPSQNVQTLLNMLPPGIALDLDIITYSRGGLVGREMTERLAEHDLAGRAIEIRKAVLVASPNQGTALVDERNATDMINRYTNLLAEFSGDIFAANFQAILLLVKSLSFGTLEHLPGVFSMFPNGAYLQHLNSSAPNPTQYYAIGANFTPAAPALLASFAHAELDKFVDRVFGAANDGIVPTIGSYRAGDHSPGFPIPPEHRVIYGGATRVHHCNYFAQPTVNEQIRQWLAEESE